MYRLAVRAERARFLRRKAEAAPKRRGKVRRIAVSPAPSVAILVLLRGARAHAEDALESLSARCQTNVDAHEFEVIALDTSPGGRARDLMRDMGPNVRFVDASGLPNASIRAFELGFSLCAAPLVGLFDGSPIATPRVVEHALAASRLFPRPVIAVPGYELGDARSASSGDTEHDAVLSRVDFRRGPYDLFESARLARANEHGYLSSMLESEAFFCTREMCAEFLPVRDPQVRTADDLYVRLLRNAPSRLVVLGGEACFRAPSMASPPPEDIWLRADRQPVLFGVIPGQAQEFLRVSVDSSAMHSAIARQNDAEEWPWDRTPTVTSAESKTGRSSPKLSIAVVAYRSPRQIENTLHSLSAAHQQNVREDEYEIVVVENRSSDMLGEERARGIGRNVRYYLREEPGVSPAPALNFAVSQARGDLVGLLIDGARMATPRVVEHALLAARAHSRPLIVVPGYHLGPGRQHVTSREGYDESVEVKLLEGTSWKQAGYALFDIGCFDEATKSGFLSPILEATYLFVTKSCFDEVGGLDERFDSEGGGEVNHDLFERMCRLPDTRYIVLWGEGNFHQYHGGVSTTAADRERKLEHFRKQYDRIRGHRFRTFEREPWLIGTSSGSGLSLLAEATSLGRMRFAMVRDEGRKEWENG